MMAALLIKMSAEAPERIQSAANSRTLAKSLKSSKPTVICAAGYSARSASAAAWPCARLRTASVSAAPALAKARDVSSPNPDAPPVTIALRPASDKPLTASTAVVRAPNEEVTWASRGLDIKNFLIKWLTHVSSHCI